MMKIRIASVVLAASLVLVGCEREPAPAPAPAPVVYQDNQIIIRDGVKFDQSTNEPITGVVEFFYEDSSGRRLERRANYVDGLLEGLSVSFDEYGRLEIRRNYVNGEQRLVENFYEDGRLESRSSYVGSQAGGLQEWFHRNGQLHNRTNWVDGQIVSMECWNEFGADLGCE